MDWSDHRISHAACRFVRLSRHWSNTHSFWHYAGHKRGLHRYRPHTYKGTKLAKRRTRRGGNHAA